jgi:nicotinate-nucleotide adenylyltransferase
MKKERIGIFGGTFNPIHKGHVKAALEVQEIFLLDRILLIPSYIPPHKGAPDIAPPSHRFQMVELAVAPYPQIVPSSIEIDAKGKSYSILTLAKLKKRYPNSSMFFILGVDAFLEIDTWRDYEKVLEQCHFIVISRPGYDLEDAKKVLGGNYTERVIQDFDSVMLEKVVLQSYKIFLLSIPAFDIASKDIRRKVKMRESIADLVAERVEKYISSNKLYQ